MERTYSFHFRLDFTSTWISNQPTIFDFVATPARNSETSHEISRSTKYRYNPVRYSSWPSPILLSRSTVRHGNSLDLETARPSPAAGSLELPTLASHIGFLPHVSIKPPGTTFDSPIKERHTLWLWGPKPKCLTASREFFGPRRRSVLAPVGARRASWSRVMVSPPAFSILALAVAVKRRAATDSFGTLRRRLSSVTLPMITTVLSLWDSVTLAAIRESETGGRLILDIKSRRNTTLLKFESVRPMN